MSNENPAAPPPSTEEILRLIAQTHLLADQRLENAALAFFMAHKQRATREAFMEAAGRAWQMVDDLLQDKEEALNEILHAPANDGGAA